MRYQINFIQIYIPVFTRPSARHLSTFSPTTSSLLPTWTTAIVSRGMITGKPRSQFLKQTQYEVPQLSFLPSFTEALSRQFFLPAYLKIWSTFTGTNAPSSPFTSWIVWHEGFPILPPDAIPAAKPFHLSELGTGTRTLLLANSLDIEDCGKTVFFYWFEPSFQRIGKKPVEEEKL